MQNNCFVMGEMAQLIAHRIRNRSVVSSRLVKGSRCFIEQ